MTAHGTLRQFLRCNGASAAERKPAVVGVTASRARMTHSSPRRSPHAATQLAWQPEDSRQPLTCTARPIRKCRRYL